MYICLVKASLIEARRTGTPVLCSLELTITQQLFIRFSHDKAAYFFRYHRILFKQFT